MRLYDVENGEYDGESSFRSTRTYRCCWCHCISNEFIHPHFYLSNLMIICPGKAANKELHELLWEKIENGLGPQHPASVIKELKKEIKALRLKFKDVVPNVVGIENWNPNAKISIWNSGWH